MSAQVTEAHPHQSLVRSFLHPEHWGTPLEACAIRLIADSEAAAKQSLLAAYDAVVVQRNRVTTERDRLRAELDAQCLLNAKGSEREAVLLRRVDRMAKECLNLRADLDAIKAIRDEETARAERAEAELAKAKAIITCIEEDGTEEHNAAVSLRRELAAERARLDYMSNCGFEHLHNETGDHLGHEWTISSYGGSRDVTLRDVIDAEMKEDTK